ncbi:hypothetical protein LCGC14_1947760 [marine sediment metagenome]|uniref:Uncharacterized protein n=1 Tax=marine sediment metagenome TaxID=412755 RepID=A0A0F9HWP1_9ZZZZ|nr:hypothetical protein [Leeuwenhoekiella sp.]
MNKKDIKAGNERARNNIKKGFHSYRNFLSEKLAQWDERLSIRQKWVVYSALLFVIISLLSWKLVRTINSPAQVYAADSFEPTDPYGVKMEKLPKYDPMKGRAIYMREYLDSLRSDPTGKITYDSIVRARPGLLDSISFYINR